MARDDLAALRTRLVKAVDAAKNLRFRVKLVHPRANERGSVTVERDGETFVVPEGINEWDVLLGRIPIAKLKRLTKAQLKALDREIKQAVDVDKEFAERLHKAHTEDLPHWAYVLFNKGLWGEHPLDELPGGLLHRFAARANAIVTKLEEIKPGCFANVGLPSMDVKEIMPGALHHYAFGTDDVVEAGRRMLAWSAAAVPGSNLQPKGFERRYRVWSKNLVAVDTDDLVAYVQWEPFTWAVQAFDQMRATIVPKSSATAVTPTGEATDQEPKILARHLEALQAMFDLGAVDCVTRRRTEEIAKRAWGKPDYSLRKQTVADLVLWGLAGSQQGRGGGAWISADGKRKLNRPRKPKR